MSRFTHLQAVLFDLDGTLVDSAPDLGHAADLLRLKRGLPSLPYEQYRPMAGAGARGMIGIAFGYGPDHPEFEALRQEFFANYEACLTERTRAFDGIAELIGALLGAIAWNVVTWYYGIPSSSSHALIGGIVGAAIAKAGGGHPRRSNAGQGILDLAQQRQTTIH